MPCTKLSAPFPPPRAFARGRGTLWSPRGASPRTVHRPPRCGPPLCQPRRARNAGIPVSARLRPPSLARCPRVALERVLPSKAVQLLQAPALPPGLSGHPGTGNPTSAGAMLPRTRPPAEGLIPRHPLQTPPSGLRFSPREPRGYPEIAPDRGLCTFLRGAHQPWPAGAHRAPLEAGLRQPDSPMRSPPLPALSAAPERGAAETGFFNVLAPPPGSPESHPLQILPPPYPSAPLPTPTPSPAPAVAGRRSSAVGGPGNRQLPRGLAKSCQGRLQTSRGQREPRRGLKGSTP